MNREGIFPLERDELGRLRVLAGDQDGRRLSSVAFRFGNTTPSSNKKPTIFDTINQVKKESNL